MNVGIHQGPGMGVDSDLHPLVMSYVDRLSGLVGFLSHFIVHKQCQCLNCGFCQDLNEESAMRLCKAILIETQPLVGPLKSMELETELMSMTRDYFNGGIAK